MDYFDYERKLADYFNNLKTQILARPLNLGGVSSFGGGVGGPPGGFIGKLPQIRVTYDFTEAETWDEIPSSGASGLSLLTNLNRIRYRIKNIEDNTLAGGIRITDVENGFTASGISTIDFDGATLTDLGGNTVRVSVSGASGEGSVVNVQDTSTINLTYTDTYLSGDVIPSGIKLDDLGTPDDNTDLNASISRHGLLPKLPNDSTKYLNGVGEWYTPSGTGGSGGAPIDSLYIVSSSDSTLTNEIVIPSFAAHADIAGAGGAGTSEEWDTTTIGLTSSPSDPNLVFDSNTTIKSHLVISASDSTERIITKSWSAAGDFVVTTKIHLSYTTISPDITLYVANAADTEAILFNYYYNDGDYFIIARDIVSGTLYSGTAKNIGIINTLYLKMQRIGTKTSFQYSLDGVLYSKVEARTHPSFTATKLGFKTVGVGGWFDPPLSPTIAIDWLRTNV